MKRGIHFPPQGASDRAIATAVALDAACLLWLAMDTNGPHKPGDALRFPNAVHLVRLPNPGVQEASDAYVRRVEPIVTMWRGALPDACYVIGNEPEEEAGWPIDAWLAALPLFAAMVRARFPGIKLAATPFLAANAARMTAPVAAAFDAVCCHCYWGFEAPANVADPQWGRNYLPLLAYGKDVFVSEVNASPANRDPATDWHERNRQIAQWIAQADGDGVAGCCIFLADGQGQWSGYDVGPEAAADILAQIPVPPPPPPPPPPENTVYTPSYDPRGYRPLDGRWLPFIAAHNPGEAAAICESYDDACRTIGYDANAAIAQGCVETAIFTSQRWRVAHNAAGIGIYSDGTPDVQFGDVQTGIRAQAELLADYYLSGQEPWGILKRYGFGGMNLGKARLSDMDGVWAADTGYSIAIAGYLNTVLGGDAPAPSPTPATGITLADIQRIAASHVGNTSTAEGNPEYGMCEQFVEEVLQEAGLPRVRFGTAAQHATLLRGQGALHTEMPPPAGSVLWWLPPFDPNGHTCIADSYPYVLTTYPGAINRIDAAANGWYAASGFAGWWIPDGVSETPTQEVDVLVQGHLDAAMIERLWYGNATKTARKKMGFNPDSAIGDRWKKELLAGRPLGAAQSGEEKDAASGRIVQYFTSGAITFIVATGETFVN